MDPLFIIDGSGYIFRAYYAIAPLSNTKGLPTNALLGFTRMLLKLLKDREVRYVAVAFDMAAPTFRHKMYSEYKANRAACPEDLVPQMPYFRKIVDALGIARLEQEGFEADDIIAALVETANQQQHHCVVVSGDKDLTQLVSDNVDVWDPMRDVLYDASGVEAKFGVSPEQIVDYLALTGDSSDNIPGVKGIGPKSAAQLLQHFGSVDELCSRTDEIENIPGLRGAKRTRTLIESDLKMLRLSQDLVRLNPEVPSASGVNSTEEYLWNGPNEEVVVPLLAELEFESLLKQVVGSRMAQPKREAEAKELEYALVTDENFEVWAAELKTQKLLAFDTETTSLDIVDAKLAGISVSWSENTAWYLPLSSTAEPSRCLELERVRDVLDPFFRDPSTLKIGFNLKYDISVLLKYGFGFGGKLFDSMLASYVLDPDGRQHGLKHLAKSLLGEEMATFEETLGDKSCITEVELDRVASYAGHDADASLKLYRVFEEKLGAPDSPESPNGQRRVFEQLEMPLIPVLAQMELEGIKIDIPFLERLEHDFAGQLELLEQKVYELAGREFNLNSPKQLGQILFEELGISTKGVKRTKTGYSTNAAMLHKLAHLHPIVAEILEYRELFKLQSTYVTSLSRIAKPDTARVHSSFNQAVAATGRLSSSDPNLQNIPIRNPRGKQIRNAFIAEPGKLLLKVDYSQIELRVLAHLADDAALQRAFIEGEDIHLKTAIELFGAIATSGADASRLRRVAKTINFGVIYGMSAFRLANELGISRKEASRYIDDYFARYPKVSEYYDSLSARVETDGYVETMFGRRRYLKDIDTSGRDAGYASRSLMNAPIQGSAAEIIKLAMCKVAGFLVDKSDQARMLLQVHDELVFEVDETVLDSIRDGVVKEMETAIELAVPLKVDVSVGRSWGEGE